MNSPSPVTTPLVHLRAETLEECREHSPDQTNIGEFSTEYDGSLVIRGIIVAQPSSEFTREDIARIVTAMNSGEPTDEAMNGAQEITEAQVVAWLMAQQMALDGFPPSAWIAMWISTTPFRVCCTVHSTGGAPEVRESMTEAIAAARANIKTPAQQAAEKRATAAKLLAEADALASQNNETRINAAGDIA